jgi:antitoxin FitA
VASLSIRDLDDDVRERLRIRAAQHGRSMEAEIRAILVEAVSVTKAGASFLSVLHDRVGALGDFELAPPSRTASARAVEPPA